MKVCLCGIGAMGSTHAALLKKQDVDFVAVADAVEEKRTMAEKTYGVRTYSTAKKMIKEEKPDAVLICLPTYLHKETAIYAMENGCHVFCEKPMALTPQECKEMEKVALKTGKILQIGQVLRFKSEYIFLKEAIQSGKYGKLESLFLERVGIVSIGWQGWFLDEKRGGMQIFDRHIHDADIVSWILGMPKSVTSFGFEKRAKDGGITHSITKYNFGKKGPLVVAEGSADLPKGYPFTASYRAIFEKGCVEFNSLNTPTLLVYEGDKPYEPELPKEMESLNLGLNQNIVKPYLDEQITFFDCIKNGTVQNIVTPESARKTVKLVRAEIESVRSGKTIDL